MPNKAFKSEAEKCAIVFTGSKRQTYTVTCSSESEDYLIMPPMLYKSINPRTLNNQIKGNLPVIWPANHTDYCGI